MICLQASKSATVAEELKKPFQIIVPAWARAIDRASKAKADFILTSCRVNRGAFCCNEANERALYIPNAPHIVFSSYHDDIFNEALGVLLRYCSEMERGEAGKILGGMELGATE